MYSVHMLVQITVHYMFMQIVHLHNQVFTLSHNHLLHTDPTLSRQILKLAVDRGDLDFIKHLVNNLSVDVNGELMVIYNLYYIHR